MTIYMDDIRVFKAAYNMYNCVNLTDICKELVSKTLTLRCALYKTGDINKLNNCGVTFAE